METLEGEDLGGHSNHYQIGDVLKKGRVLSTLNRQVCMKRLMDVEEAKVVSQDRSKWKDVISAYPSRKKA